MPEFWSAALALEPGDISPVTETQYGYHILKLEERKVVPFTEARSVVGREVADRIEDPNAVLEEWMAELERAWDDEVYRWSAALGFRYGLRPQQVGESALDALARPAQGADLARADLLRHADLLSARYDIRTGSPGG